MNLTQILTLACMELTKPLLAIGMLLLAAHLFGYLFQKFKIPRVIGEIFAGLLLGPTVLGFFSPTAYNWIFNTSTIGAALFSGIYLLALPLLMFVAGLEIQRTFDKDAKVILSILFFGTLIPFIAGYLAAGLFDTSSLIGLKNNMIAFKIIAGLSVAVTAIPVISKIFMDLGIINTSFARIVLTAATVEDVILWTVMAIIIGMINGSQTLALNGFRITFFFFILAVTLLLLYLKPINLGGNPKIKSHARFSGSSSILIVCFILAAVATVFHANIIFWSFITGIIIATRLDDRFLKAKNFVKYVSLRFFVPIYFSFVGLKLDLIHQFNMPFFLILLAVLSIFKIGGTMLGAKLIGKDWFSSLNLGIAMNTRGVMGIVIATLAFDMGIISKLFFTTLVMIDIVTSLLAGYWLKLILSRKLELLK